MTIASRMPWAMRDMTQSCRWALKLSRGRQAFVRPLGREPMRLDRGAPVHVVAARCGHDPAVLLRSYAKRTRKADTSAAAVIGAVSKGVLRGSMT